MVIDAAGTLSCSAAICISAVLMPCPSSALPVKIVNLPSALMLIQASSIGDVFRLPGRGGGESTAGAGACWARAPFEVNAKLTIRRRRRQEEPGETDNHERDGSLLHPF